MRAPTLVLVFVVLLLTAPVHSQTAPPLTVSSVVSSCSVTVRQSWAPTPNSGWGVQFTWQAVGGAVLNFGNRDVTSPYVQTRTFQAGTYTLGGTWTRTGSPAVAITPISYTCGASTGQPPPPPPPPPAEICGDKIDNDKDGQIDEGCPVPPLPPGTIWPAQVTDPEVLGQCGPAVHDRTLQDGGDGFRYYTWHPQTDPSGCIYKHEHGNNPAPAVAAVVAEITRFAQIGLYTAAQASAARAVASAPLLMGKVARLMPMPGEPDGHREPHEGFKVFYTTRGEGNDEGRRSRITSVFLTHMGTGGVGRYTMPHHSVIARQVHDTGRLELTQTMKDFGIAATVCDPRVERSRDFIAILTSPCQITSGYEIWKGHSNIGGYATTIATPAVFDPITVMNRSNPSELVYAWDPRVLVTRAHDSDDWSTNRGCDRESYAQMPVTHVPGFLDVWTDASGAGVLPAGSVTGLRQVLYSPATGAPPPGSDDGNVAFKVRRRDLCGQASRLGLKN